MKKKIMAVLLALAMVTKRHACFCFKEGAEGIETAADAERQKFCARSI